MDGFSRFMILLLLLALLYALYMYQQQTSTEEQPKIKDKEESKKKSHKPQLIDEESTENISIDNISQLSLGSLRDLKSNASIDSSNDSNFFLKN